MTTLTKEDYLKALKTIEDGTTEIEDYESFPYITFNQFAQEISVLKQLINEHFDNPPLKFEELHEGMWVWDNKDKEWCKCLSPYLFEYLDGYGGIFEENRFYRKELKE